MFAANRKHFENMTPVTPPLDFDAESLDSGRLNAAKAAIDRISTEASADARGSESEDERI